MGNSEAVIHCNLVREWISAHAISERELKDQLALETIINGKLNIINRPIYI